MYNKPAVIKYIVLALLIAVPVFGFLDTLPIRVWDEARIAINALEMFDTGNFIVTTFDYSPEMWNTKPPLLIWCQVFFMHIIGTNEIAVRLPTALAVFGTCLALLIFIQRYLKDFWLAFIAIIVLITSNGYVGTHVSRTGDYDAMLTFFTTLSCLFFFTYCETKRTKFLYLFFGAVLLATYTKGIAGLLFFPALAIYALLQKQFLLFLKNKHFYIGFFSFLSLILAYYVIRESMNPGYISIVQENELGGRYLVSQGNQPFNFWFYLNNFKEYRLSDRYLLIPCGMAIGFFNKNEHIKKLATFLILLVTIFFVIISTGKTRLEWYDAPLYPFLAILIAFPVHFIFDLLRTSPIIKQKLTRNPLPYLFLFLLFLTPYRHIWDKTYIPQEAFWDKEFYDIGYFLKNAVNGKYELENKHLAYDGYKAQNTFYMRLLNDKGVNTHEREYTALVKNDEVFACQDYVKEYIRNNYRYKEKQEQGAVYSYTIYGSSKDTLQ